MYILDPFVSPTAPRRPTGQTIQTMWRNEIFMMTFAELYRILKPSGTICNLDQIMGWKRMDEWQRELLGGSDAGPSKRLWQISRTFRLRGRYEPGLYQSSTQRRHAPNSTTVHWLGLTKIPHRIGLVWQCRFRPETTSMRAQHGYMDWVLRCTFGTQIPGSARRTFGWFRQNRTSLSPLGLKRKSQCAWSQIFWMPWKSLGTSADAIKAYVITEVMMRCSNYKRFLMGTLSPENIALDSKRSTLGIIIDVCSTLNFF